MPAVAALFATFEMNSSAPSNSLGSPVSAAANNFRSRVALDEKAVALLRLPLSDGAVKSTEARGAVALRERDGATDISVELGRVRYELRWSADDPGSLDGTLHRAGTTAPVFFTR